MKMTIAAIILVISATTATHTDHAVIGIPVLVTGTAVRFVGATTRALLTQTAGCGVRFCVSAAAAGRSVTASRLGGCLGIRYNSLERQLLTVCIHSSVVR